MTARIVFFLSILTLAVDSMFAILEVSVSAFRTQFRKVRKAKLSKVVGIVCILSFLWSLSFVGGNGLFRLDILDHFLFSHLFYLAILCQVIIFRVVLMKKAFKITENHHISVLIH